MCLWCLITSTDKLNLPWPDGPARGRVWGVHACWDIGWQWPPHMQVTSLERPKLILLVPAWGQGLPTGAQSKGQECLKPPQKLPVQGWSVPQRHTSKPVVKPPTNCGDKLLPISQLCLWGTSYFITDANGVDYCGCADRWQLTELLSAVSRPYESDLRQLKCKLSQSFCSLWGWHLILH